MPLPCLLQLPLQRLPTLFWLPQLWLCNRLCGGNLLPAVLDLCPPLLPTPRSLSPRLPCLTPWAPADRSQGRFMQEVQLEAVEVIRGACDEAGVSMAEAALRWMMHHSQLGGSSSP